MPLGAEGAAKSVRDFTGGEGAQCAFDMVGLTATMKAAADYVGRGGQIIVIGEEPELPPIDTIAIAQRELEIIGSRNGGLQDAADALTMLAGGILAADRPPLRLERAFRGHGLRPQWANPRPRHRGDRPVTLTRQSSWRPPGAPSLPGAAKNLNRLA